MPSGLRHRFWLESVPALITGAVAIITLFWHDWIEIIFKIDPDMGNGSLERAIVGMSLVLAVAFIALARREWRRAAVASA